MIGRSAADLKHGTALTALRLAFVADPESFSILCLENYIIGFRQTINLVSGTMLHEPR